MSWGGVETVLGSGVKLMGVGLVEEGDEMGEGEGARNGGAGR